MKKSKNSNAPYDHVMPQDDFVCGLRTSRSNGVQERHHRNEDSCGSPFPAAALWKPSPCDRSTTLRYHLPQLFVRLEIRPSEPLRSLVRLQARGFHHLPPTIARKQHSAGRGSHARTTSPSISKPKDVVGDPDAPSTDDSHAQVKNELELAPTIGVTDDLIPASLGLSSSEINGASLVSDDLQHDVGSNILSTDTMVTAAGLGGSTTFTLTSAAANEQPGNAMLDAQAVQAQVEALIKSSSPATSGFFAADSSPTSSMVPFSSDSSEPSGSTFPEPVLNSSKTRKAHEAPEDSESGSKKQKVHLVDDRRSSSAELVSAEVTGQGAHSFQNTFAQYQYPQNHDRAMKEAVRASSAEAARLHQQSPSASDEINGSIDGPRGETSASGMTREEEERAADALIQDVDSSDAAEEDEISNPFASVDLAAAAKAIGLDADTSLLGGTEADQRALAVAIKRLGDEHGEAAQKAIQQAAAAAAAAAAAHASQELAKAAGAQDQARRSGSFSSSSSTSQRNGSPVKRFACTKCDKAFARAFNLNTHLATHDPDPTRSKPFACPYPSCKSEGGRSFSRKHDLQRHVASIHEREPEPGIKGDPQEVKNGDTGGLVSLGLGTPGKKFRCESCGRSFVRRDACHRHQCDGKKGGSSQGTSSPVSEAASPRGTVVAASAQPSYAGSRPNSMAFEGNAIPKAGLRNTASGGNPSSSKPDGSLSREVQAVAKQLQARVQAQGPIATSHKASVGKSNSISNNDVTVREEQRRPFPLTAMSLYAGPSASSSSLHSRSGSNAAAKVQSAK